VALLPILKESLHKTSKPVTKSKNLVQRDNGIWRIGDPHWEICGIPDVLYTDNGSDFRSKHLEQVAASSITIKLSMKADVAAYRIGPQSE
jgi:transposase InsO family protein